MNNNLNERIMLTPYKTLEAKKNNYSKPYLMIAELVDNCIDSWNKNDTTEKLSIEVRMDFFKRKIVIEDNAFGMSKMELLNSVEFNKEKQGNVIGMFGVGLKNASFWFGQDMKITSNNGEETNTTSVLLSEQIKRDALDEPVKWRIETGSILRHRGTRVEINNVYKDRSMTDKQITELLDILEVKYRNYLIGSSTHEPIAISFIHIDKYDRRSTIELEANPTIAQIIPEDKIDKFIEGINLSMDEPVILKGFKEEIIHKARSGQPLSFKYDLVWDGNELNFELGVISEKGSAAETKKFKSRYGITAYQSNRAIRIAGVNPIGFKKYNYTRTDIKRMYGYVELGEIFRPDNNKADFYFGTRKTTFETFLNKIGTDFVVLCEQVKNVMSTAQTVKKGTSKASRKKLSTALATKSVEFNWDEIGKEGAVAYFNDKAGKKVRFDIVEVSTHDKADDKFFVKAIEEDEKIIIYYNVDHAIWKPLTNDNNAIDLKVVLYPLVAIMGLSELAFRKNLLKEWTGMEDEDDYLDTMKNIANFGMKID